MANIRLYILFFSFLKQDFFKEKLNSLLRATLEV